MYQKYFSFATIATAIILTGAGCTAEQSVKVDTAPASSEMTAEVTATTPAPSQPDATKPPAKQPTAEVTAKVEVGVGSAPVQFTSLGIDPSNNKYGLFKVKILSAKKVTQVDMAFKSYDANGAVVRDTNFAWQNIINGEQLPIEQGKTYEGKYTAGSGSVKAEARMTSVVFEDGTSVDM